MSVLEKFPDIQYCANVSIFWKTILNFSLVIVIIVTLKNVPKRHFPGGMP